MSAYLGQRKVQLKRVPTLRAFRDLEKTVLHEIRVSGTVLRSPTNAKSPTCMYTMYTHSWMEHYFFLIFTYL